MKNLVSSVVVMLLAALIGFAAVHAIFRTTHTGTSATAPAVVLNVEVKDARGKPLRGVAVARREAGKAIPVGLTNERGRVSVRLPPYARSPNGTALRVEASKRGYVTMVSTVPVPTGATLASRLFPTDKPVRALLRLPRSGGKAARGKRATPPSTSASPTNPTAGSRQAPTRNAGASAALRAAAPVRPFPISVVSGAAPDRPVASAIAARLARATAAQRTRLAGQGIASFQVRMLWNEASYVEILPVTTQGRALGGVLLATRATDEASLATAVRDMLTHPASASTATAGAPSEKHAARGALGGAKRTLTVSTTRPSEARAYLDGRPLARRIIGGAAVFEVPATMNTKRAVAGTPNAHAPGTGRVLTLTSDNGPLIRSVLPASGLRSDVRWTLPDAALSRR